MRENGKMLIIQRLYRGHRLMRTSKTQCLEYE